MIWGGWKEPNRQVRVTDTKGRRRHWITFVPDGSDVALHKRLEDLKYRDIKISAYDFQQWKDDAQRAERHVIDEIRVGRKPEFDDHLYGLLKQHLFDLSNNRCAYCEAKLKHVDNGAVEHYRPKASVREDPAHSGYYWLAYDPTNLLPSCGLCNTSGKHTQFPVAGSRATSPQASLEDERPLLINPYKEDPLDHLKFLSTGDIVDKTERGKKTIEICLLERLREFRREAMERLATKLNILIIKHDGNLEKAYSAVIEDLSRGQDEYCNALMDHLEYLADEAMKQATRVWEKARLARHSHGSSAGDAGPP